jgi:hypothetical protein
MVVLVSSPALAQTGSTLLVAPRLDDAEGRPIPFTLGVKLESTVGQGTFVSDPNARNALAVWGASIAPGYRPTEELLLSVYAKVTQEITDSDVDTQRQQLILGDVNLRSDYLAGTIPVVDIMVMPGLWLYLPTSPVSQFETLMLAAAARLVMQRRLGEHFAIDYLGIFRKNFHEYESPVVDAGQSAEPPTFARRGGNEDLPGSLVAVGQNNVSYYFYNLLAFSWMPSTQWSALIGYAMTNSFTYASFPRDELSSPYSTSGAGQRDSSLGVIELGYMPNDRFWFSAGITTIAAPKSEDNQSFRFPFYDFEGQARNYTLFYLDVTIREPLGG